MITYQLLIYPSVTYLKRNSVKNFDVSSLVWESDVKTHFYALGSPPINVDYMQLLHPVAT